MTAPRGWRLANPEREQLDPDIAALLPARPPLRERKRLKAGDDAKVLLLLDPPPNHGPRGERIWLKVTAADNGHYHGHAQTPFKVVTWLRPRTQITFTAEHVLAVDLLREYQVLASARVLEHGQRPTRLYSQRPLSAKDSGWRAFAGGESRAELRDPACLRLLSVRDCLTRWPELAPVFADRRRTATWMWDAGQSRYRPLPPLARLCSWLARRGGDLTDLLAAR